MLSNTIRIIGGKWRGKKLSFPANSPARPTLDQIRETLFNWLQPIISESRCLDMFAGSGALGIEALSRGAAHVTFVDQDASTLMHLSRQLQELNANNSETLRLSMPAGLSQISPPAFAPVFDIIFLDPPFDSDLLDQTLNALATSPLVKSGTQVYFETSSYHEFNFSDKWTLHRHKKTKRISYGLLTYQSI
ncbi:MAG: 16S rRNA (guanine(966)-N(2))-methyltransferase RsmD [Pseudomonadota bacterium]